ncbi:hypothetical protein H2248_003707 [Termitomyces sp. 'cryptogamus']|nr:hypothetical protein H2248_003707 [Termitomyces sp. 'cryptogamus']
MICTDCPSVAVSLPQYGFSTDVEFDKLVKDNHFLFRVYTPRARLPFVDDSEPYFLAPKFNERWTRSPEEFVRSPFCYEGSDRHVGTYEDVAIHMDFSTKSSSPYISTSFSFIWSIWEALRRYHLGVKKDVEIAVIDASAVSQRAASAIQLLQTCSSSSRRVEHWKWYRYAQESQSVLVYEYISTSAVLASIPLVSLLEKLPSYFLRHDMSEGLGLASLAWDYTEKKRNFHRFCQEMSNRFLQSSEDTRLENTTAGSVRLAMAFLRPWFYRCVVDDFQTAAVTLCALSFNIAQWPGQWWAQEHSELWNLICAMVISLAEEVRRTEGIHHSKEVVRLQGVIVELENAVEKYKKEIQTRKTRRPARLLTPLLIPPPLRLMPFLSANPACPAFLGTSESDRTVPVKTPVKTPITPPTSPIRSGSRQPFLRDSSPLLTVQVGMSHLTPAPPGSPYSEITFFIKPPSSVEPQSSPLAPVHDQGSAHADAVTEHRDDVPDQDVAVVWTQQSATPRKPPTMAETASCLVTGILIGAFVTLCLLSPQRRTLLTHLT